MNTIIVSPDGAVLQACDSTITDPDGNVWSYIDGRADAVYPVGTIVIYGNVTLPSPWPGNGYTYINGVFTQLPAEPTPVPETVTPRQARLALLQQNLLDSVETMVNSQPRSVQIWYQFATTWERSEPLLNQLAAAMNLTQQNVDDLFRLAETL